MDFELSSEQDMLKNSVERFVQDKYGFDQWQALRTSPLGYSEENWATFADMGWLALPVDDAYGGLGGQTVDIGVLMQALGAGMVLEPVVPTVLLGAGMVQALGSDAQKSDILPGVTEGRTRLALAYGEPHARYDLSYHETTASPSGDGYSLNGHKAVVLHAASADWLIVMAQAGDGLSAFLVTPEATGLRRQDFPMVDGTRASDIWLTDVPATLLGTEGAALPALEQVINTATCAICAEAVGAMSHLLDMTKDYAGTRQQFGRAIGDNQVVQHRLVDMYTAVEEARAITDMVTMQLDDGSADASRRISAMKAKVGEAARFVGGQGVQLHGGIGMTDEYPVGHYFKRLMALEVLFGDTAHHLNRFAETI